jgi:hypothetical protein
MYTLLKYDPICLLLLETSYRGTRARTFLLSMYASLPRAPDVNRYFYQSLNLQYLSNNTIVLEW